MTTVVRNSMHGRSRTSRSRTSCAFSSFRPHPEQISFRWPRFRRIHSFSVLACSWISCRYTRYPGHPSSLVSSLSRKLPSLPKSSRRPNSRLLAVHQIPAQSLKRKGLVRGQAQVRRSEIGEQRLFTRSSISVALIAVRGFAPKQLVTRLFHWRKLRLARHDVVVFC